MYVHSIKAVTNGVKKCEPLNDLVEDVPVGVVMEGNRNISDSLLQCLKLMSTTQYSVLMIYTSLPMIH